MPELPEVQTIVNGLNRKVRGRRITGFWTDWPRLIKLPTPACFRRKIKGARIKDVRRKGKNILINLDRDYSLLIHQKMTGHLMVGRWSLITGKGGRKVKSLTAGPSQDPVNQFIHALFYLDNGKMIALSDMRKFARLALGKRAEVMNLPNIVSLGPDALDPDLNLQEFKNLVTKKDKAIKTVLMDQSVVAGIGNIYADDILWEARIHPLKKASSLSKEKLKILFIKMRTVLKRAINLRGTSVGDYRDTAGRPGGYQRVISVYQKTGKPCRRCGTPIKRIKINQRSAHFCPNCQKL
ncbi:MAG: DNA-formamidopyrimidine glycosylase [Candidatus Colwellbacteria bacterium RBG_13_48_8]|uniref:DNA-formamidopyrimidine glycosylase n=1 Tax=Candidatus Colwellbacteria bacterium RBG_13_48_8 TaxID=1797685 RepID=A0A1G1YXS5_9BACT|nr:MAG: DNA-formamidopyrimidine glycosylase [Candidatus Colwellbacteria bacterium RBG_13_48_8]